jgi:hypothetical protein
MIIKIKFNQLNVINMKKNVIIIIKHKRQLINHKIWKAKTLIIL